MAKVKYNCECCGKKIVDDNSAACNEEGSLFCDDCAETLKATCCICGNEDHMWNMTCTSQDEIFCEHCATAIA